MVHSLDRGLGYALMRVDIDIPASCQVVTEMRSVILNSKCDDVVGEVKIIVEGRELSCLSLHLLFARLG